MINDPTKKKAKTKRSHKLMGQTVPLKLPFHTVITYKQAATSRLGKRWSEGVVQQRLDYPPTRNVGWRETETLLRVWSKTAAVSRYPTVLPTDPRWFLLSRELLVVFSACRYIYALIKKSFLSLTMKWAVFLCPRGAHTTSAIIPLDRQVCVILFSHCGIKYTI